MTEARLRQGEFPTVSEIVEESAGIFDELFGRDDDRCTGGDGEEEDEDVSDAESSKDDEEADPTFSPDEGEGYQQEEKDDDDAQGSCDSSQSRTDDDTSGNYCSSSQDSSSSPLVREYDTSSYDARVASRVFENMGGMEGGCGVWRAPGNLSRASPGKCKRGKGGCTEDVSVGKVGKVATTYRKKKKKQGEGSFVHRDLGLN